MVRWFKTYREENPNSNIRKNPFIMDFRSNDKLEESIFLNPLNSAVETVHQLINEFPGPYVLLASGGIDSQAMIWAWHTARVPFQIWHWSYLEENLFDTNSLINFLDTHKLTHLLTIKTFDARSFITSPELINYAGEYDCVSPQILTYIRLVEQTPGTVFMSGNFIELFSCGVNYTVYGLERFSQKSRKNFIPFFFLSSPKLAYSFFKKMLLQSGDHYDIKSKIYLNSEFPILIPNEGKRTGFEKIKDSFDNLKVNAQDRLKWSLMPSQRPFDLLYRYGLFDHIGEYSERTLIKHHDYINKLL
jgi:hypothetical protein